MYLFTQKIRKTVLYFVVVVLLTSCSTSTEIVSTWAMPDYKKSYNDLLIIGIGESEQTRRAYESNFTEELKLHKIKSTASYLLIKSSEDMNRDTIVKAIKNSQIDAVLTTHMVAVDEETVYRPSPNVNTYGDYGYGGYDGYRGGYYGGAHYGSLYNYYPHVNSYVHDPGYYTTHQVYTLESNLYDVETEELIWTARSRTFSPESVDEVIVDLTKLIIEDLETKNLIKIK